MTKYSTPVNRAKTTKPPPRLRARTAPLLSPGAGFFFFSHEPNHIRSWANELDVARLADGGEVCIFGKQSITGVDRIDIRDLGGADHRRNVEIALRQLRRTNANGFVGKTDVQRIPVSLAIDCDRADAEFLACANDTQGYLAAIRY